MYDYERLDGFSQDFADVFFRQFPHYRKFARVLPNHTLEIDDGRGLAISTERREITVFTDEGHRHFDKVFGQKDVVFREAIDWIQNYMQRLAKVT